MEDIEEFDSPIKGPWIFDSSVVINFEDDDPDLDYEVVILDFQGRLIATIDNFPEMGVNALEIAKRIVEAHNKDIYENKSIPDP
jgi:hypothetical protein